MKNPYLYLVISVCLAISIIFTLSSIISTWSGNISIERYSYLDTSSDVWRSLETKNIYGDISSSFESISYVTLFPVFSLINLSYKYWPYIYFPLIMSIGIAGPFIAFTSWFIVFYLVSYFYSRFIKKNYLKEPVERTSFIIGSLVTLVILTTIYLIFGY